MQSVRPCFILAIMVAFSGISCSFNYGEGEESGAPVPEMVLGDVSADRYENSILSVAFSAKTLEMYNSERIWAADEISFVQYASDGSSEAVAKGSAGLLLVDDAAEIYSLGEGVSFELLEDSLFVSATDLCWSKKARSLSGTRSGEVVISKGDGTLIRGIAFHADTASRAYEFAESASGLLVSDDVVPVPEAAPADPESGAGES